MSRPRKRRSVRTRTRRAILICAGAALGCAAILFFVEEQRQALRRREAARAEAIRAEAAAKDARVAEGRRSRFARELARIQTPPIRAGRLLATLAKTTPLDVSLREVACEGDGFVIRGHAYAPTGPAAGTLLRFHRDLFDHDAPWQGPDLPAPGGADPDFVWHGVFLAPASPPLAESAEIQLAAARRALPAAADFDDWMRTWARPWKESARSEEIWPGLVVRHYAFAYARPRLAAWSAIVQALQALAAEPGVSVDSLVLSAPEEAAAFTQAQMTLTARLRP